MTQAQVQTTSDHFDFKEVCEEIAHLLSEAGLSDIRPFAHPNMLHFSKMSVQAQKSCLTSATHYLNSLASIKESGWSLTDEKRSLWVALKFFGLRPTSDLLDLIEKSDAVEVYDLNGLQIWRNYRFMEVCSYTVEEIFCYPWDQRYYRDPEASAGVLKALQEFLTMPNIQTVNPRFENTLTELFSSKRYVINVRHDYLSPLHTEGGQLSGFVVISKVEVVGSLATSASSSADTPSPLAP